MGSYVYFFLDHGVTAGPVDIQPGTNYAGRYPSSGGKLPYCTVPDSLD